MTFLIRNSSNRIGQDYTLSIYTNDAVRHIPIYRDDIDLMVMSATFTSLVEIVSYFSRTAIFGKVYLKKPAKSYSQFISEQNKFEASKVQKYIIISKPLEDNITLKIESLRVGKFDFFIFYY